MREQIINSLEMHFTAQIEKHRLNVEVMLENPRAIPEHTDYITAIENELTHIAEYMDKLEALETHFK